MLIRVKTKKKLQKQNQHYAQRGRIDIPLSQIDAFDISRYIYVNEGIQNSK